MDCIHNIFPLIFGQFRRLCLKYMSMSLWQLSPIYFILFRLCSQFPLSCMSSSGSCLLILFHTLLLSGLLGVIVEVAACILHDVGLSCGISLSAKCDYGCINPDSPKPCINGSLVVLWCPPVYCSLYKKHKWQDMMLVKYLKMKVWHLIPNLICWNLNW